MSTTPNCATVHIREVWADNLEHEFQLIWAIVHEYPYLAMDTEFPGSVVEPVGNSNSSSIPDYRYQTMRANVDLLKLIQLGLTFSDDEGNLPRCGTTDYYVWQFNFSEFNPEQDPHAYDAIKILQRSGIDFQANAERGVDASRFRELLMSSGIVFNEKIHWVTFHGSYDFGYLLKLLTCQNLPSSQAEFFNLLRTYFPRVYDVKYLMKFCNNLHGGLNRLAQSLDVERIGQSHQAGSDSLLTLRTFHKLKESFLNGSMKKYAGMLYGMEERILEGSREMRKTNKQRKASIRFSY